MPSRIAIASVVALACLLRPGVADPPAGRPAIGLWYTAWWTSDDACHHWSDCQRLPVLGRYTAGDPAIIKAHYDKFRDIDIDIDFLIMDDTNGIGNDGERINDNIRAWFDFMDAQPADARIPICIGGGGEMRAEGAVGQKRAADFYFATWAQRPSYFQVEGKPLLLVDTDKNYGPGDFDDPRFTVRWAYNGGNVEAMAARKTWGWGACEAAPVLEECMSIWPGHRYAGRVRSEGTDREEAAREGGDLYVREFLRVIKAWPRFVTIADWNNFQEESAIEDSPTWEDRFGYATPNLYTRITRAYSRLRLGQLVKGEYYRDEGDRNVFLFDGEALIYQSRYPTRAAVILVPAEELGRMAEVRG
jgi:hypothetical protein